MKGANSYESRYLLGVPLHMPQSVKRLALEREGTQLSMDPMDNIPFGGSRRERVNGQEQGFLFIFPFFREN